MARKSKLINQFRPELYSLLPGSVQITGRKVGAPSKRITLHAKGLKVTSARVSKKDRRLGTKDLKVERVNHHAKFEEVRIHTEDKLFPGEYSLNLVFSGGTILNNPSRTMLPSIDEPEAWDIAKVQKTRK